VANRLGLFGGTFDPPHRGHEAVLRAAWATGWFDSLLVTVAGEPWQKADTLETPAARRLAWAAAAFGELPGVTVSDRELRRRGPTYTATTVAELGDDLEVSLLVGVDTANRLETWHDAEYLRQRVDLVVVPRDGAACTLGSSWRIRHLDMEPVDLSSTQLRGISPNEELFAASVHPAVYSLWRQSAGIN
jgi:nicotinate-nucleotide adenylyltransferase